MIVFIDTEVNPQTKKVADYGAAREDGAVLHTSSKADFDVFVSECDAVCGHNIIGHDLKYTSLRGNPIIIDTLFLSLILSENQTCQVCMYFQESVPKRVSWRRTISNVFEESFKLIRLVEKSIV